MDAEGVARRAAFLADGEAVWSRRPDAGAKPLESYERGDGDNKARSHRGDHGISRKAIAQGMFLGKNINKINGESGLYPPLCRDPR